MRTVTVVALAAAGVLSAGRGADARLRGGDDRVPLHEGSAVATADARLSPDQVSAIRRAIYALRPKIGLGVGPACTGTAISEKLILTAGHCAFPGGMKAYQKHVRPHAHPVDLALVHREFNKRTGADIAIFARKSGKFAHFLTVDTGFDFTAIEPGDRFGFPAFPYEKWNVVSWPQTKLLFSPVTRSREGDREVWFGVDPCRDDRARTRHAAGPAVTTAADPAPGADFPTWCQVRFRAVFYDGNSGSPMLRFHRENGAETMSVVAVGTVGVKGRAPHGSLSEAGAPTSLLRDVLPALLAAPR